MVFYGEIVKFRNVHQRIFDCCDLLLQMCQSKRRATAWLNEVLNPPKKARSTTKGRHGCRNLPPCLYMSSLFHTSGATSSA